MEQLLSTGSERLHPTMEAEVWDADTGSGHSEKTAAQFAGSIRLTIWGHSDRPVTGSGLRKLLAPHLCSLTISATVTATSSAVPARGTGPLAHQGPWTVLSVIAASHSQARAPHPGPLLQPSGC